MFKSFQLAAIAALVSVLPATTFAQNTYSINVASTAPTIDGIVSAGEWADAESEAGGWRLIRVDNGPTDAHNNRFRMMWDETHLYLLAESDFDGWTTNQREEFRTGANNLTMYFDPDLDNEGNQGDPTMGPFTSPDGYQIAVNQYAGSYSCTACSQEDDNNIANPLELGEPGSDFSTFAEAHIDGNFGNQGEWLGMRGTVMASVNGSTGGVVEMAIPWSDFDAPGLDANDEDPGLNLNGEAPSNGDEWLFNIGQITTDRSNLLPAWNWHTNPDGLEFFAQQPHGVVTFVSSSVLKGDVNMDNAVNFLDISPFITALSSGTFLPEADVNCDSSVNFLDIAPFINVLSQ